MLQLEVVLALYYIDVCKQGVGANIAGIHWQVLLAGSESSLTVPSSSAVLLAANVSIDGVRYAAAAAIAASSCDKEILKAHPGPSSSMTHFPAAPP